MSLMIHVAPLIILFKYIQYMYYCTLSHQLVCSINSVTVFSQTIMIIIIHLYQFYTGYKKPNYYKCMTIHLHVCSPLSQMAKTYCHVIRAYFNIHRERRCCIITAIRLYNSFFGILGSVYSSR